MKYHKGNPKPIRFVNARAGNLIVVFTKDKEGKKYVNQETYKVGTRGGLKPMRRKV